MAAFVTDTPRPIFTTSPSAPARGLLNRLVAWNKARQTRDALMMLSDRELDDIGLTRGDIDRIAKRSV